MNIWKIGVALALVLGPLGPGCGVSRISQLPIRKPKSADEVGEVHVSIVSVAPWHAHVAGLKPGFALTGEQALGKVVPSTRVVRESDRVAVSGARSTAVAIGDDATATAADVAPPALELGAASAPTEGLGTLEPFLVYGAATALHQEVAMLNRYVEDAATLRNSVPYLVRLQVTQLPYDPRLPLDTYVDLKFAGKDAFGGEFCDDELLVLPLVATESLEHSLVEKTFELMLAAELARQISVSPFNLGVGAAAGPKGKTTLSASRVDRLRAQYEKVRASLGRDVDATFLVGAKKPDTAAVRIGASNGGSQPLRMIPRNHYVSLLVMVPTKSKASETKMADASIEDAYRPQFKVDKDKATKKPKFVTGYVECEKGSGGECTPPSDKWSISVTHNVEYRWRGRGKTVPIEKPAKEPSKPTPVSLPPWWNFHMALCTPVEDMEFAGINVSRGCLFEEPVAVFDDGKKAEIVIPGVKVASPENLSVVVYMKDACDFVPIRSTQVTWHRGSKLVRATLPSIKGITKAAVPASCPNGATPGLEFQAALFSGEPRWDQSLFEKDNHGRNRVLMPNVHYRLVEEAKPTPFPIEVIHGASHVTIDEDGRGHALVIIGKTDPAKQPTELRITAVGADLVGATLQGTPGETAKPTDKGAALSFKSPGVWRIELANAVPSQPITVTLTAVLPPAWEPEKTATTSWTYGVNRTPPVHPPHR